MSRRKLTNSLMVKFKNESVDGFFICLNNIPMSPSANRLLMPMRGRLISTPQKRTWEKQVQLYRAKHILELNRINFFLKKYISSTEVPALRVDAFHCFPQKKLFTKQGHPKKIDANNRLKGTLDAVSNLIGIDDKYFFNGNCEKIGNEGELEYTIVHIKPTRFQNVNTHISEPF